MNIAYQMTQLLPAFMLVIMSLAFAFVFLIYA